MEKPVYELFCGGLLATIKRPDVGNHVGNDGIVKLTERQRRIYHLIAATPDVSVKQMSEIFAVTERTIERDLAVLQKKGIVRHEGKARTGHWVVLI